MEVAELDNGTLGRTKSATITIADGKTYKLEKEKITFPTGAEAKARVVLLLCRKCRVLSFELSSGKGKMFSAKSPRKVIKIKVER